MSATLAPKRNNSRTVRSKRTGPRKDPLLLERSLVKNEITRLECYIAGIERHKKHSSRERIVTVPAPHEYTRSAAWWSDESAQPVTHAQALLERRQTRVVMSRFLWNMMFLVALISLFWYGMTTMK